MIAHTVAKSLLFTSAAGLEAGAGGDDLEQLRARARRTPWSGFGLVVGSVTLAGLPPTVGFVSEWFLLESLMQQFRVPGLGYRLVLALAGASVALTAGFAGVTFVRLVGLVVKRNGPEPVRGAPLTYGWSGRAAVLVLSVCCLAIAAVTPLEIRVIAAGLSPVVPGAADHGRAEVAMGAPAGVRRVLDPVAVLAVARDAGDAARWSCCSPGPCPGGGCCGCGGSRRGTRPRSGSTAWTPTPPSATPTRPAGCWPASCTPAPRCRRSCWSRMTATRAPGLRTGTRRLSRSRSRTSDTPLTWWRWWRPTCTGPRSGPSWPSWPWPSGSSPGGSTRTCSTC